MGPAVGGVGIDKAVSDLDIGAEGGHALDMLVDGTDAEVAAAGHGGLCAAEAAEHCADKVIRRPDLAHEVVGGVLIAHLSAVYLNGGLVDIADLRAKLGENGQQHIGIAYLRHVLYTADAVDHEGCRNYRNGGILRAADLDLTAQCGPAFDYIFLHCVHLPILLAEHTLLNRFLILSHSCISRKSFLYI